MFNLFRKKRDEASYKFQEIGFHGDEHLLALVDEIVTRQHIECFIETGTNVGSTLAYFAKRYPQVPSLSCEPDAEAYRRAKEHIRRLENVELFNTYSQEFLAILEKRSALFAKKCLFWLDAHGYGFEWPLREEVHFIVDRFETAYVMIDDFRVPGLECFRYDEYKGQVCAYEHIRDALGSRPHQLFYPRYQDRTSRHHPLTGWGLIVLGADYIVPECLGAIMHRAN